MEGSFRMPWVSVKGLETFEWMIYYVLGSVTQERSSVHPSVLPSFPFLETFSHSCLNLVAHIIHPQAKPVAFSDSRSRQK